MNYRNLENTLAKYTKDWSIEEGSYPAQSRADLNNAKEILKQHYKNVESLLDYDNQQVDGTDYKINFGGLMMIPSETMEGPLFMGEEKMSNVMTMFLNEDSNIDGEALAQVEDEIQELEAKNKTDSLDYSILQAAKQDILKGKKVDIDESIDEAIEKHDELNPDLWENNELKPEVKDKLLEIVGYFTNNLKEDEIELDVKDIVIIGSNANYNYTKQSDIDTHIVADMTPYKDVPDLALKLYNAYRSMWNNKYDPTIYGHEVELYVEPEEIKANSNGMYSLNTGWLKEPVQTNIPDIDEDELNTLVGEYENKIEGAKSIKDIEDIIDSLYLLRQESILKEGEFGIGNQCFKEIRNMGLLQNLKDKKIELENQEMSLEKTNDEVSESLLVYIN